MRRSDKFVGLIELPNRNPPGRVYVHTAGYQELFRSMQRAEEYSKTVLTIQENKLRDKAYFLGIVWADLQANEQVMDLFGYSKEQEWPGNPEISGWVLRNGIWHRDGAVTCTDGLAVLDHEERYRETTSFLQDYTQVPPSLPKHLERLVVKR